MPAPSADTLPPLPDFLLSQDDGATPPLLPTPLPLPLPIEPLRVTPLLKLHTVRCGCWLISYVPKAVSSLVAYDGTLRVECHSAGRTASGDLYQRDLQALSHPAGASRRILDRPAAFAPPIPPGHPDPAARRYRYYMRSPRCPSSSMSAPASRSASNSALHRAEQLGEESTLTAQMKRTTAPGVIPRHPTMRRRRHGAGNAIVGRLTMAAQPLLPQVHRRDRHGERIGASDQQRHRPYLEDRDGRGRLGCHVQLSDTNVRSRAAIPVGCRDARRDAGTPQRNQSRHRMRYHVLASRTSLHAARHHVRRERTTPTTCRAKDRHLVALDHRPDLAPSAASASGPRPHRISAPPCMRSDTRWVCSTIPPIAASCAPATRSPPPRRRAIRFPTTSSGPSTPTT